MTKQTMAQAGADALQALWHQVRQAFDAQRHAECQALLAQGLALKPGWSLQRQVDAWQLRGACAYALGDLPLAHQSFSQAARLCDALLQAPPAQHGQDGQALLAQWRSQWQQARLDCLSNLSAVLCDQGLPQQALALLQPVLQEHPQQAPLWVNQAHALRQVGDLAGAQRVWSKVRQWQPHDPEHAYHQGGVLVEAGQYAQALAAFTTALALQPDHPRAATDLSVLHLLLGRFGQGWALHHWRPTRAQHAPGGQRVQDTRQARVRAQAVLDAPWQRRCLGFVFEQGIGDELFYLAHVQALHEAGVQVLYAPSPRLGPLLVRQGWGFEVLDGLTPSAPVDVWFSLGDAPWLLDVLQPRPDTHPRPPSLPLRPLPERVQVLQAQLAAAGPGPYLGVNWASGARGPEAHQVHYKALHKSVPPRALGEALRDTPGTVVLLQRLPQAKECEVFRTALGPDKPCLDACHWNDDLEDLLAGLSLLDGHVGTASACTHFRLALGQGGHVLVPDPPEWRWPLGNAHSPWFEGFEVLRQGRDRDWSPVLKQLGQRLSGHNDC